MANDPAILVADEPTGSLDSATAQAVIELFEDFAGKGGTILLASHDRDIARQGSRSITLSDGMIIRPQAEESSHDQAALV
jgi:putative ABC transport system ATP-binding protein